MSWAGALARVRLSSAPALQDAANLALHGMLTCVFLCCCRSPSVNRRKKRDPEATAEGADKADAADEAADKGAAAEGGKAAVKAEKDGDSTPTAAAAADGKKEAAVAIAAAEKAKKMTKRQREAAMSVSMPVRARLLCRHPLHASRVCLLLQHRGHRGFSARR